MLGWLAEVWGLTGTCSSPEEGKEGAVTWSDVTEGMEGSVREQARCPFICEGEGQEALERARTLRSASYQSHSLYFA